MGFSAASFAELSARYPVSAGEAAYVRAGFNSKTIALIVGLVVISAGVVSAATISLGAAGYVEKFIPLPGAVVIGSTIIAMGLVALLPTRQSVLFAGILTLIEIGGLIFILGGGVFGTPSVLDNWQAIVPTQFSWPVVTGIYSGAILAFFAFIGFEDMVNVAEETRNPSVVMPRAIFLTLGLVTVIYFLVSAVAVLSVAPETLAASSTSLGLVFETVTGLPPAIFYLIAIVATLNGVIIQIIMASRVVYGLGRAGNLPKLLTQISNRTGVPIVATGLVTIAAIILALSFSLEALAGITSRLTLGVFIAVNLALVRIKLKNGDAPRAGFRVPIWIPVVGVVINSVAIMLPI